MTFKNFDLSDKLMMGLRDLKYEEPTPIQEACIPLIFKGKDVIGAAQTGTGKTGAFVIPLLQEIANNEQDHTRALILSPTRELAQQIEEQIFALGYHTGVSSATVTGGSDYGTQVKAIRAGVDIIVATPGRLIDQMNVLNIDFSHLDYLVLDEADRMLDMGFLPDVMKIVKQLPKDRQTMLFSATMVEEVQQVVDQVMIDPVEVEFEVSKPADSVDQQIYFVHPKKKIKLFEQLFDADKYETAIVFCATKKGTDQVERMLKKRNVNAVSMHGDRDQKERNEALRQFKNRTHPVMVATDVLSRGIDIDDVSLIVNFDVPNNPEDYIHRIGRTGRYDKKGTAITFVSNNDKKYYHAIKNVVGDQLTVKDLSSKKGKEQEKSSRSPKKSQKKKAATKKKAQKSEEKQQKQTDTAKKHTRKPRPAHLTKEDMPKPEPEPDSKSSQKKEKEKKKEVEESQEEVNKEIQKKKRAALRKHLGDYDEDIFQPEVIGKAVLRNKRSLRPAKGIWGVIKSYIPKIGG
ncbi:Superfamily II DNA and RNA helicase [Fodinibius salinus]|uniref:Superfamily II DNA and RNA helicase n=1 Tax=Fodinibius salinus TaxID=860790 RepID=A0A5D3YN88_9BACT|nr:DEAD/DEAH box helicase [Fodinibius salinus]TYP95334.1 Superfamily II DNA and RNA helicase [Fodinibius salinus]